MSWQPMGNTPKVATRLSLRDQVVASLRAALVAGEMVPGEVYSAPALAERFGISATPVREAMLDLIKEGVIVAVPNKGFRVVENTQTDLDDIVELRRLVEVPTVGRIATTVTKAQVAHLRGIADRAAKAAARHDTATFTEADREFHLELLRLSGNSRIVDLIDQLRITTRPQGLEELAVRGDLDLFAQEHLDLVDALAEGDKRAAERVMARHLTNASAVWAVQRT